MGMEEWPQVAGRQSKSFNHNKDFEQDKKGHFPKQEVMPYAYREEAKTALRGQYPTL